MTASPTPGGSASTSVGAGRPVRFKDPVMNAAYWARIDRIVSEAPPLTTEQKAIIRVALHAPQERRAAA